MTLFFVSHVNPAVRSAGNEIRTKFEIAKSINNIMRFLDIEIIPQVEK
jgi:hypothetical protein